MFFKKKRANQQDILEALGKIQAPNTQQDIVTAGWIRNLKCFENRVSFNLELPQGIPEGIQQELKALCTQNLRALPGIEMVAANVSSQPPKPQGGPGMGARGGRISLPDVKNVIAVASGKGGVGKSTVTINLAAALAESGARVGLLDADIYGPSIPLMMGIKQRPAQTESKLLPVIQHNIKLMSMGFLTDENQPVVWRGPMVHGALTQFLNQVDWGKLDYLLIDMPPGTGDAQLTISQSAPLSGAVIVTTPQEVSLLDARKGLMMFQSVKIPILGVIENMSGFVCPGCDEVSTIFKKGGGNQVAAQLNVPFLGAVPLDPRTVEAGDAGTPMVSAYPASPSAESFKKMGQAIATQLAALNTDFQPLSLEWK